MICPRGVSEIAVAAKTQYETAVAASACDAPRPKTCIELGIGAREETVVTANSQTHTHVTGSHIHMTVVLAQIQHFLRQLEFQELSPIQIQKEPAQHDVSLSSPESDDSDHTIFGYGDGPSHWEPSMTPSRRQEDRGHGKFAAQQGHGELLRKLPRHPGMEVHNEA